MPPQTAIDLEDFINACEQAGIQRGINTYYLVSVAQIESGIRNIPAGASSAFGPFQIIADTWRDLMADEGFTEDDRMDPYAQPFVAARIAADAMKTLATILPDNRKPTPPELYLAHLLGLHGAKVVLSGSLTDTMDVAINRINSATADAVIRGNRPLFVTGSNRFRTVKQLLGLIDEKLAAALTKVLPENVSGLAEPTMEQQLVAKAVSGDMTFYVVQKNDDDSAGQLLIRQKKGRPPEILLSDTSVFPITPGLVPADVVTALSKSFHDPEPPPVTDTEDKPASGDISARVLEIATTCAQAPAFSTRDAPGTDNGNLACAFAVNEIVKRALGKPVGGGLSTANMFVVLQNKDLLLKEDQVTAGSIVISPTNGKNVGHVGIVGEVAAKFADTPIFSNSSARAAFLQNFTVASWKARYKTRKGLPVAFFRLNKERF